MTIGDRGRRTRGGLSELKSGKGIGGVETMVREGDTIEQVLRSDVGIVMLDGRYAGRIGPRYRRVGTI